jgi:hypothetical protein
MGTTRKQRGPEKTPRTTISTTVRLSIGLRNQIEAAANKRRRSMAREIENRLKQSFADDFSMIDEFGDRQILALARIAFAAARSTVSRAIGNNAPLVMVTPRRPAINWLDDPAAFDAAVAAINRTLELIRPAGAVMSPEPIESTKPIRPTVPIEPTEPIGPTEPIRPTEPIEPTERTKPTKTTEPTYKPAFNAEELVREIATAPLAAPARASRHVRATIALRNDIGEDILDRVGGSLARTRSSWAKEYGPLRRKQVRAPATMTNEELARMRALIAERERLLTDSTAISKNRKP